MVGAVCMLALLSALAAVQADVRDIPVAPKYIKNYNAQFKPPDELTYVPNYVIENFAGTRDARYVPDEKTQALSGLNGGVAFDYGTFTDNGFASVSGGEGVPANYAKFTGVYGLANYNETGDVFITDYCVVRKVDAEGIITVYAGSYYDTYRSTYYDDIFVQQLGQSCGFNDNTDRLDGLLSFPYGLAVDGSGNLYIADTENLRIRLVDRVSQQISTFAGYGHGGATLTTGGNALDSFIGHVVTITYGLNRIWFAFYEGSNALDYSVWSINIADGTLQEIISPNYIGVNPYGSLWVTPDNLIYVAASKLGSKDAGIYAGSVAVFDPVFGPYSNSRTMSSPFPGGDGTEFLSITGDLYNNIYFFYKETRVDSQGGSSLNNYCYIYFQNRATGDVYLAGGGDKCGSSTVGAPAAKSKVMPGYFMTVNKYNDLLWAQHYQESYADKTFYVAGVMSLTLTQPTSQPTGVPTGQPSTVPTGQPSGQPSGQPTSRPSTQPSGQPTSRPTGQPSSQPSGQPSGQPTSRPTGQPSCQPTMQPSMQPSSQPSGQPSGQPTVQPSGQPTSRPSSQPTSQPSGQPTSRPSSQPSTQPSCVPTSQPTSLPTGQPTSIPTSLPTSQPTSAPTSQPSSQPTYQPTNAAVTLTRGEITGAVVGAVIGTFILAVIAYFAIAAYRKSNGVEEPNVATNEQV